MRRRHISAEIPTGNTTPGHYKLIVAGADAAYRSRERRRTDKPLVAESLQRALPVDYR